MRHEWAGSADRSSNSEEFADEEIEDALVVQRQTYDAHGYGEGAHTALKGVYLIDADTGALRELAPAETSFAFVPSPDGRHVALVTTTGLTFVDIDSGRRVRAG